MPEIYHIKIKKEYATALVDDLLKVDAVEDVQQKQAELPQWQKNILDIELKAIADNPNYAIAWDNFKNRFKHTG